MSVVFVASSLALRCDGGDCQPFQAGYESLSQAQVLAVAAFLEFIATQQHDPILLNDARAALASYWRERAA